MANTTYTVVAGDNLTKIAAKYNTTVNNLVELNNLPDPNYIVVGQVLIVSGKKNDDTVVNGPAVVSIFGLQTGTDRTIYAAWPSWERANTEKYEVRWYYDVGDNIGWIRDVNSSVDNRQSLYSGAPANATRVRFVMRPVAKVDENDTVPWTAPWSEERIYLFENNPPTTPEVPSDITIDKNCWMSIELSNVNVGNADMVEFQIAKIDSDLSYIFHTGKASINTELKMVSYGCRVNPGEVYKVRCRSVRGTLTSAWSNFSNGVGSIPDAPARITTCRAKTATSVYLEWSNVASAESYDIQHTTDESHFDNSNNVTTETGIEFNHYEVTGLEAGVTHFFRVRAKNESGKSGWSQIVSTAIGAKPTSPTTWSSKSTVIIGEIVTLYWAHNVEDGSDQTGYMLELNINGIVDIHEFETSDEFVDIDTNELGNEDSTITWRVKTKGITGEYCDEWSASRVINVYVQPSLALNIATPNVNVATATGDIVSLSNVSPMEHKVKVNVTGVSDGSSATVKSCGKNIFNSAKTRYSQTWSNTLVSQSSDEITLCLPKNSLSTWSSYNFELPKSIAGKTVTISADIVTSGNNAACMRVMWVNGNTSSGNDIITDRIATQTKTRLSKIGVVPTQPSAEYNVLCLMLYSNSSVPVASLESGVDYYATYSNIQVEINDGMTKYEPYVEGESVETTIGSTVELESISPNMTVYTETDGVILDVSYNEEDITATDKLTSFPFYILGSVSPVTQKPIGYHVNVTANESYDTVDNLGNEIYVKRGDSVYSEYFDTSEQLMAEISANDITLENNIRYTITVVASLDSGLTAEATYGSFGEFQVAWASGLYVPNAQVNIDKTSLTASIRPYCEDTQGNLVTDVFLSVYRRDFDGRFTEIALNLDGANYMFVTDPHPALDYARYRIVAKSKSTGAISYYDMPGVLVGEKAAIIQWDESWSDFESITEKESSVPPWSGSLLKLPYNIDISDKYQPDVSHVEYIGREHPVSYHGTQTGETSVWNTDVVKNDIETLYTLRRLSIWRGNVYARTPSGSGYWATVVVSFGQKHKELTVPVTINVTRVEGGA